MLIIMTTVEVVGYLARYLAHDDPFKDTYYLMQIVLLTLAPVFICASIYICLGRIVSVYGKHISRLPPVWYTIIFVTCDFISLVLQGTGGGLTSSAETTDEQNLGMRVMLVGLIFQVATLAIFGALCLEFGWRVRTQAASLNANTHQIRHRWQWKAFIFGLALALLFVIIRSAYRVAEMSGGYDGSLMKDQWTFLVFEGICMMIAAGLLLAFHPGPGFGGVWSAAKIKVRSKGDALSLSELVAGDDVER
ncbi:putative protein C17G6,02c [Talaromyces islandicus]|uniref:Sphingoid long-chain base transporter RSB1 n=1 Tax=Talaromyces islandicus TaxID=28573 RepID=A0A0U1M4K1_TALIS|nr:putative protein C17G6,02c [Talaromyces islandicus]